MKKYGKYEFKKLSDYGVFDMLIDQYAECIEKIDKAEKEIKRVIYNKEDARKERDVLLAQKDKLQLNLKGIVHEVGGFGIADDFLTEMRKAMEVIIKNPTLDIAFENGLYDNAEYYTLSEYDSLDDKKLIKTTAKNKIKAVDVVVEYLQDIRTYNSGLRK